MTASFSTAVPYVTGGRLQAARPSPVYPNIFVCSFYRQREKPAPKRKKLATCFAWNDGKASVDSPTSVRGELKGPFTH